MSKGTSDVRNYVGLHLRKPGACPRGVKEKAGKSEKLRWHPGMSKAINKLSGDVTGGGRENWD
jgi:hypothetical protein